MATFYLDLVGGNDANNGTSFANRWLTFASGATAARIAPSDVVRVMESPPETLIGDATWTNLSRTVTLAGAVTANITTCESNWTASANVTPSAIPTGKEGTNYLNLVIASGFTTGLAAYFATGTLDLSSYQQVSFWIRTSSSIAASTLSFRLCSDVAGVTTVNTIAIPALSGTNAWTPVTVNTGGALGSAIASIALYCDLDPGSVTLKIDNIIACKAASSADSLSLTSLIGKSWNVQWAASTAYAADVQRIPTQPNRNGFRYKVTAGGGGSSGGSEPSWPLEIGVTVADGALTWTCVDVADTWYGIKSINGVTVTLDNDNNSGAGAGRGYSWDTETVATYKREPLSSGVCTVQDSGTSGSEIQFVGGWNTTDMSTQTGETWIDGRSGTVNGVATNGKSHLKFENISVVRFNFGFRSTTGTITNHTYKNCYANNCTSYGLYLNTATAPMLIVGCGANNSATYGISWLGQMTCTLLRVQTCGNLSHGGSSDGASPYINGSYYASKNNATYGLSLGSTGCRADLRNFVTGDNGTAAFASSTSGGNIDRFSNSSFPEATPILALTAFGDSYVYSNKHNQTADNHLVTTDGGTIISATDQRHTASGISWKFRPTSTNRSVAYPLRLSIAKVAVSASALVTISIWTRRDSTNIAGQLLVLGGQIAGVGADVTVSCAPSINTWAQSSDLTFTPTEAGVVEVHFLAWDGVGTTNNFWVDDISIVQA